MQSTVLARLGLHGVDQVADDVLDIGSEAFDRDCLVERAPQPRVVRRVAEHRPVVEEVDQAVIEPLCAPRPAASSEQRARIESAFKTLLAALLTAAGLPYRLIQNVSGW